MRDSSISPQIVRPVDEHEEYLEDEPFIFIAAWHLNHEKEDAQFVESQSFVYLDWRKVLLGDPLIYFAKHAGSVRFVCSWIRIQNSGTLPYSRKSTVIHLLIVDRLSERRSLHQDATAVALSHFLIKTPVLNAQSIACLLNSSHGFLRPWRPLSVSMRVWGTSLATDCILYSLFNEFSAGIQVRYLLLDIY